VFPSQFFPKAKKLQDIKELDRRGGIETQASPVLDDVNEAWMRAT
jgi:hypothetical protein